MDTPHAPAFPALSTERLLLRPIAREDTPFVVRHFLDPLVQRYLLDEEPMTRPEQAASIVDFYLERPDAPYNRWIVVRRADGTPLGTCGFHKWSRAHARAEIGYDLSPAFWGQGYMGEAVRAMLEHGFGPMGLQRVEALVALPNTASANLLRRLGFQREGVLRAYYRRDGVFYDHQLFACLRDELLGGS
jgi:ribosomal-protein-alanine N-acetyltransferase